jgi:hypothetical protein
MHDCKERLPGETDDTPRTGRQLASEYLRSWPLFVAVYLAVMAAYLVIRALQ